MRTPGPAGSQTLFARRRQPNSPGAVRQTWSAAAAESWREYGASGPCRSRAVCRPLTRRLRSWRLCGGSRPTAKRSRMPAGDAATGDPQELSGRNSGWADAKTPGMTYAALGDSMSIDDCAGGPGRGAGVWAARSIGMVTNRTVWSLGWALLTFMLSASSSLALQFCIGARTTARSATRSANAGRSTAC